MTMNELPPGARATDPETSHAAARARSGSSHHVALRVYADAGETGCTWDDLVSAMHEQYAPSGIASIPNVLLARGWIAEAGRTRSSRYGRENAVRVITDAGTAALAELDRR